MKKILNLLFIFMYFILTVFILRYHDINAMRQTLGQDQNQTALNVKGVEKIDPNRILDHILKCTKKYGLTVSYIRFENLLPHQKQEISLYISDFDKLSKKVDLKSGRFLNQYDDASKYLSTKDNVNDPNQVGVIKYFNKNMDICIKSLKSKMKESTTFGLHTFYVNTDDSVIIKKLISDLENKYKMEIYNFRDLDKSEILPNRYDLVTMLFIPYFLILVILVYIIFSRYKELAIYKMHGASNNEIFFKVLLKEMVKCHIGAVFINLILVTTYISIFNGLGFIFKFLFLWIPCIFIFTLLSLLVISIPLRFLLRFIKIPLMLKNKAPNNISLMINYIFKYISVLILLNFILSTSMGVRGLIHQTHSIETWEESKHFAKINISSMWRKSNTSDDKSDTCDEHVDFGDLYAHKFFVLNNRKGGILIDANNYKLWAEYLINKPPYAIEYSIDVNNNYLKLNPIYDINNKVVNIPDHNSVTMNLLVPEKFKIYHQKIIDLYSKQYSEENIDFDINIIYVKDNQSYFTYNLDIGENDGYKIKDPIVQVISNNNSSLGNTYYGCALTHSYYARVENYIDPFSDVKEDLIESGLIDYVWSATTIYEMVAKDIYHLKEKLVTSVIMLILSITTIAVITVSICVNYLEYHKLKNAILKIHGVSFASRYIFFYLNILLIWTIGVLIDMTLDKIMVYNANISVYLIPYLLCMVADIVISSILLKNYENKKISSVLKGE